MPMKIITGTITMDGKRWYTCAADGDVSRLSSAVKFQIRNFTALDNDRSNSKTLHIWPALPIVISAEDNAI